MKKQLLLLALSVLLPFSRAFSQEAVTAPEDKAVFTKAEVSAAALDPLRYTIDPESVSVELTGRTSSAAAGPEERGVIGSIVTIVNIANKIWGIIKANAPVADVETKYAAAVPEGALSPNQLYGWKGPETYEYKFHAKNMYGGEMVTVSYKVVFSYGGKFDGKGAYLTGVTIVPGTIEVGWGYRLSMNAFVPDTTITNIGTYADPKAAMQLKLSSRISTVLKEWDGNSVYLVKGDGELKQLVSPFKPAKRVEDLAAASPLLGNGQIFGR